MKRKFLTMFLTAALVVGSAGVLWALPILNDGSVVPMQYNDKNEKYGDYVNSGALLFIAEGENNNGDIEAVEVLIESSLSLSDTFELVVTSVNSTSNDGNYTGLWEAVPAGTAISFYAVKAANAYAMYLVEPAESTGSWSTFDLAAAGYGGRDGVQISHFTGYNPTSVPEPTTMLLLGTGLVFFAGVRMRNKIKR